MNAWFSGLRTGRSYPLAQLEEFGENGESLELVAELPIQVRVRSGHTAYERFRDFWYLDVEPEQCTMGEGNTPLIKAPASLKSYTGLDRLYLKNESANPTWSFKDRGTLATCAFARQLREHVLITVSTGNMGQSVAAYAARCGLQAIVIVPATASPEKLLSASLYGAKILRVDTADLGQLKDCVANLSSTLHLRISSGANPIRVEGYKFEAFEIFEQLDGVIPDFIAVPTSAGGHIRGLHKGWRELEQTKMIESIPRMILVQAAANAPLADALISGLDAPLPCVPTPTLASALTSNAPPGGVDIIRLAHRYQWLAETVTEEEIREGWICAARAGLWLEPSSALLFPALRKLSHCRAVPRDATVVAVLTGAGFKDTRITERTREQSHAIPLSALESKLKDLVGLDS